MNTETGEVKLFTNEEAKRLSQVWRPINPERLSERAREELERTGRTQVSRNSKCPCGSGKRFKRCCMTK